MVLPDDVSNDVYSQRTDRGERANQSTVTNVALKAPRKATETSFSSEFRLFILGREDPELLQDV